MREHYWDFTHNKNGHEISFEICIYKNQQTLIKGVERFRKRRGFTTDLDSGRFTGALCHTYYRGERPVARLYFTEEYFTPAIIAHEALHAAMFFERDRTNQTIGKRSKRMLMAWYLGSRNAIGEENVASLTELIVDHTLRWRDQGYPSEVK